FACGDAVVGPSNLETFIVGYGKDSPEGSAEAWYPRLGDPRTPEGLKLLKERSPLNYAANTKGSMLVAQGANDIRVPTHESAQVEGSSVQVPVGVEHLPGLQQALAQRKDDGLLQVNTSIDSSNFGDFAGQYDLQGYKLSVTLEGKALFVDIPGQGKHEMLPME